MTKIWRKNEWEKLDDELKKDHSFYEFVKKMYKDNTHERQSESRTPYVNEFEYYNKYSEWLKEVYKKR